VSRPVISIQVQVVYAQATTQRFSHQKPVFCLRLWGWIRHLLTVRPGEALYLRARSGDV